MNCRNFLKKYDLYSSTFNLHLFGKKSYKTVIGSIMTILSIVSIVVISSFFVMNFLNRNDMKINSNIDVTTTPLTNLTYTPFIITLADSTGKALPADKLYYFDVKMLIYKRIQLVNDTRLALEIVPINVQLCDMERDFGIYTDTINSTYKAFSYAYCIPYGKYNTTLFGRFGETTKGWSNLVIFINRCDPGQGECYNRTYADSLLGNSFISVAFPTYEINNFNLTRPYSSAIRSVVFTLSSSLYKSYWIKLTQIMYNTDFGWVFEDHSQENFFVYNSYTMDVTSQNEGLPTRGDWFGYVVFQNDETIINYYRSFNKLQTVLASVGGIVNVLMFCSEFITHYLTRRLYFLTISNYLFDLESELVEKQRKSKLGHTEIFAKSLTKFANSNLNALFPCEQSNNRNISMNYPNPNTSRQNLNKLKLSFLDYLCPKCVRKHKKIQIYAKIKKSILKKISIETLIINHYQLADLAKLVLSESQYNQFSHINKLHFYEETVPNVEDGKPEKFELNYPERVSPSDDKNYKFELKTPKINSNIDNNDAKSDLNNTGIVKKNRVFKKI